MSAMYHGAYAGTSNVLGGKTALLKRTAFGWLAQFDDMGLEAFARGWHPFQFHEFPDARRLGVATSVEGAVEKIVDAAS